MNALDRLRTARPIAVDFTPKGPRPGHRMANALLAWAAERGLTEHWTFKALAAAVAAGEHIAPHCVEVWCEFPESAAVRVAEIACTA